MKSFLKIMAVATVATSIAAATSTAEARIKANHERVIRDATPIYAARSETFSARRHRHSVRHHSRVARGGSTFVSHPSGCPGRAFCGCGVSVKIFGRPIRDLFLASNWFKFPRAAPGPGMVAVRNHHVMAILSYSGGGTATVYDPNSGGHATRVHERSLAGYTVVNPQGGARSRHHRQYASR